MQTLEVSKYHELFCIRTCVCVCVCVCDRGCANTSVLPFLCRAQREHVRVRRLQRLRPVVRFFRAQLRHGDVDRAREFPALLCCALLCVCVCVSLRQRICFCFWDVKADAIRAVVLESSSAAAAPRLFLGSWLILLCSPTNGRLGVPPRSCVHVGFEKQFHGNRGRFNASLWVFVLSNGGEWYIYSTCTARGMHASDSRCSVIA